MASSSRDPLLVLLHLCDSLFPIGSFAHSDGLEAATAAGHVTTGDDFRAWMTACLDEVLGQCEGPAVALAWKAFAAHDDAAVRAIDCEVHALRPSSAARQASRAMGSRLVRTWIDIHPGAHRLQLVGSDPVGTTLPVAFGCVAAAEAVDLASTVRAFMYTRLAATASAAMRLMSIGQRQTHGMLAHLLERVPGVADAVLVRSGPPRSFAPRYDLASMSQQYVHSRLFRS
jgi:urease accessory protein